LTKRLSVAPLAALALLLLPAAPAGAAFDLGVTAGEVTSKSAILWAHATKAGKLRLQVATNKRFNKGLREFAVRARASDDTTVQKKVGKLKPGTRYFFRFRQGRQKSARGVFETAPKPGANVPISFAWSGDADAQPQPGQTAPFWNNFEIYRAMAREKNDFNLNVGDVIYTDTEVQDANGLPAAPNALTVEAKWAKYQQNLRQRNLQRLRGGAALYSHWDDHEFINDFTMAESGQTIYDAGVRAFRDYNPVTFSRGKGIYRSFRWGKNAQIFLLDERSFRSAKASEGGTCNNPQTGQPDLAPTAPQTTRNVFAALVPSLSQPVSQQCLDRINDPARTMLGGAQFNRFVQAVRRSTARFKIIINEVPIQEFYALPYDRWEGYAAERRRLMDALANVRNVIFLTTDVHANLVNTIKFDTLNTGSTRDTGVYDVTTGPVATATFETEIDRTVGAGNGARIDALFFEGFMQCSETNTYSYGQVDVADDELVVTLKDANGKTVVNKSKGEPCEPIEVKAR
jgi:alkaline phosphatase D